MSIPHVDLLTIFGLLAVSAMMFSDMVEKRHYRFTMVFAFSCWAGAAYGFMQGAWPFGLLEGIWGCLKVWQYFHHPHRPHWLARRRKR
jgi:hypothetical protein